MFGIAINVDWISCKSILAKSRQRAVIATVSLGRDNMYTVLFIVMCMIYSFARVDLVHTWQSGQVLFIGISVPAIISIRDQCRDSSLSQVIEFHEAYARNYHVGTQSRNSRPIPAIIPVVFKDEPRGASKIIMN